MRPFTEMNAARPVRVLYVLGTQRGGSTIVGRVVGALPGAVYGGEMRRLWERLATHDLRCGCGEALDTCPVWATALPATLDGATAADARAWQRAAAPDRRSALAVARAARPSQLAGPAAAYGALVSRLYAAFGDATGATVVVDGSKQPADALVAARAGVDLYVLHLVRDPRGVASSFARREGETAKGRHPKSMVRAAAFWTTRHLSALAVKRALGSRMLTMTYEEFVADPNGGVARVAELVGIAGSTVATRDGEVALPTAHTPTGNGRFTAETVTLRPDDRWIAELHPSDAKIASVLTAPLRRRFGYRARPTEGQS